MFNLDDFELDDFDFVYQTFSFVDVDSLSYVLLRLRTQHVWLVSWSDVYCGNHDDHVIITKRLYSNEECLKFSQNLIASGYEILSCCVDRG